MHLKKQSIDSRSNGSSCQQWDKLRLSATDAIRS